MSNFDGNINNTIGFEPSKNVADIANKKRIPTLNCFFNKENTNQIKNFLGKTDLICASNVICHIPDLNNLIETVDILLSKNGTFIFEEPYLGSMFKKTSYDQIYDEHIYIFSASAISKIFNKFNFDLIDILPQITHGGSMRYILKRKGSSNISKNVKNIILDEKFNKLDTLESCLNFKKNCELSKINIVKKINEFKDKGKTICGYAATSKSTTILNYCKINSKLIDYICDTTKEKIGKYSPGMHIPIVNMDYFYKNIPDSIYLFAWNHKEEIFKKEKQYKGEWFSHVAL